MTGTGRSPELVARSYLFVPGTRPERFAKAVASGAHAVVVDLEDAVAPADKDRAREIVAGALDAARPLCVRINGAGTPWFDADLALCAHPGVAAVMLPKTEDSGAVAAVQAAAHGGASVLPLIESATGCGTCARSPKRRACCASCSARSTSRSTWACPTMICSRTARPSCSRHASPAASRRSTASPPRSTTPRLCGATPSAPARWASAASCASIRRRSQSSTLRFNQPNGGGLGRARRRGRRRRSGCGCRG